MSFFFLAVKRTYSFLFFAETQLFFTLHLFFHFSSLFAREREKAS
uniref:Uncharacterized protein n=1 Tax=Rhizophora mucronata TaxID=61149 RepID=A0A2P2PCH4_RHIMU